MRRFSALLSMLLIAGSLSGCVYTRLTEMTWEAGRLHYYADFLLEKGAYLADLTFENVKITNLLQAADVRPSDKVPLTVTLKNVDVSFREGASATDAFPQTENLQVIRE